MRPLSRLIVLVALALLASGCFSWLPWVDDKGKDLDKPAELVKFNEEVRLKTSWSKKIGDGLGKKYLKLAPVIVADRVIAADGYGYVAAHDRFSGKRIWRTQLASPEKDGLFDFNVMSRRDASFVTGGMGAGDGRVLLGTAQAQIVALSVADGEEQWRSRVSSEVVSAPSAGGGVVFAQTSDGRLVALDGATGARTWTYDTQVPILTLRGTSSPVVRGATVYAGFSNGKIGAFRTGNGELLWEQRIMLPQGRSELDRIVDVDGNVLVDPQGAIFAASFQGRIKALRPNDGSVIWERDASSYRDLAEGYGHVYVVDDLDIVTAIDKRSSDVVWTQAGLYKRKLSSPIAFSNYLLVGDGDGYLHVLAQSDGRFVGRRKIDGDGLSAAMVFADGTLFCLSNGGKLVALTVQQRG
jgi:outer membrane protein assembly factor BamB